MDIAVVAKEIIKDVSIMHADRESVRLGSWCAGHDSHGTGREGNAECRSSAHSIL